MAPKRKIEGALVYRFRPGHGIGDLIQVGDYNSFTLDGARELALELLDLAGEKGAGLIAAERKRQAECEGYLPEHDDEHSEDELALAAVCYAMPPAMRAVKSPPEEWWPWTNHAWKPCPTDRVRELTKAGALIAAEIDRLIRAGGK